MVLLRCFSKLTHLFPGSIFCTHGHTLFDSEQRVMLSLMSHEVLLSSGPRFVPCRSIEMKCWEVTYGISQIRVLGNPSNLFRITRSFTGQWLCAGMKVHLVIYNEYLLIRDSWESWVREFIRIFKSSTNSMHINCQMNMLWLGQIVCIWCGRFSRDYAHQATLPGVIFDESRSASCYVELLSVISLQVSC